MRSALVLSVAWAAVVSIAIVTRATVRPGIAADGVAKPPLVLSTPHMDDATREKSLLDEAERLYRTTPPRRF